MKILINTIELDKFELFNYKAMFNIDWKFDGNLGQNGMQAIITNWINDLKDMPGYKERIAINKLKNTMIGKAANKLPMNNNTIETFDKFLNWFDIAFDTAQVRPNLYLKMKNWTIDNNTSINRFVPDFLDAYQLLEDSAKYCDETIVASTTLSEIECVKIIINALPQKLQKNWDILFYTDANSPVTYEQLKKKLARLQSLESAQALRKQLNGTKTDPTKIGTPTPQFQSTINNIKQGYNRQRQQQQQQQQPQGWQPRGRNNPRNRSTTPRTYKTPTYFPGECRKCHIWGHISRLCGIMKKFYPNLISEFAAKKPKQNVVNNMQQDRIEKNTLKNENMKMQQKLDSLNKRINNINNIVTKLNNDNNNKNENIMDNNNNNNQRFK